ncbi:MAG: cation-translocating P-type ATPase [Kiritimatiellae bacterium]|nr:cation-translocating P-type ATPase [Kiritimatiellia bacterium]MDW8459186.1 cation-translocating P-type ATPase [Verrucomicrobiota bacterium]
MKRTAPSASCGCSPAAPENHAHHRVRAGWLWTGAALVLNSYVADWLLPDNPLAAEMSAAAGALVLAAPIFLAALRDLIRGHLHMDELVALAVLAAMAQGDFRTAGIVAFFMLLSLVIETRTAEGAHRAIESLIRLTPAVARRIRPDGTEEEVPASHLRPGDLIRIRPGDHVAADGVIRGGRTTLDESAITGESLPVDREPGNEVFAGTLNLTGAIDVEVTRAGEDTTIGRVRELILAAEKTRLPVMRLVDRYAGYYTPAVLMLAAIVWYFTDDWDRVVALLVISCPCAFILAMPTAMVAALSAAARRGILIKDVAYLEGAAQIDAFVFDKTGTLTSGMLGVVRLAPVRNVEPARLLGAAAAAESLSQHPAARAILQLAEQAGIAPASVTDFHEEPGRGVRARLGDRLLVCGRASWLRENGVTDPSLESDSEARVESLSTIHVAEGGAYLGWIGLRDQIRPEASQALAELAAMSGIRKLAMVTGDREAVARRLADEIGAAAGSIEWRAECLPAEKVDWVNSLKAKGYRVAFVGDGVNDAPALAASDTGIAMGVAGRDVAIHSAAIALMSNDLRRIPFLIRLSRSARKVVYQNLAIGLVFIAVGLSLSGLGWMHPILAALTHNAGSMIVVFNSARLVREGEEEDVGRPDGTDHLNPRPMESPQNS